MRSYEQLRRINVGCGPHHIREDWWNVDIRPFQGVDQRHDVTTPWPWLGAEFVYSEHFIEHLELDDGIGFLVNAGNSLVAGGKVRISTPNLTYVAATHYHPVGHVRENQRVLETLAINCAFRGWGHKFLWSREMLCFVLEQIGFESIEQFAIGESNTTALRNLEKHLETYEFKCGEPSVINIEASRGPKDIVVSEELLVRAEREFLSHVRAGH